MNKLQILQSIQKEIDEIIENNQFNDEGIENDLKQLLEQQDDEIRTEIILYIHQHFPQFAQTQENLREKYSKNLQEKKYDQILLELKNNQYCEQNLIPLSIQNYLIPLQQLKDNLHLIFDLIELVKQNGYPNFISLLKLLINLFFLDCDNEIKGQIHQFVGSLLENQIYKFECYVAQMTQNIQIQDNFLDCIHKVQSKEISAKQGKESLHQKCKDNQILFLFELFTLKLGSHADNLKGFITNLICAKNKIINKDELIEYVSLTENFNENLDFLYFKFVFYFWIQFIEIFKIKESILIVEDKLSKSQTKKKVLEGAIKNLNSKEKNMIYRYLRRKILYYCNFEDEDFREVYQKYKVKEKEFIQKQKLKEFAEISKELMFYQLKSLQSQQKYWTKEISILSFLATNELNSNLENLIQTNFKGNNDRKLDNLPKVQKINLLHLEQSIKSNRQIKMSRFVNQTETFIQYPKQLKIKMEEFNISLTSINKIQTIVNEWFRDKTNEENFKKLLPFYFNIIKRGESPEELLSLINKNVMQKNKSHWNETLNLKSLFQLLYNNSDKELQMILLKIHSKYRPVPLLYQNPQLEQDKTSIKDFYVFNTNIYYLLSNDFPIINFSLSQTVNQFGKTELINKLFYIDNKEDQKFEISDSSRMNNNSVDCQFDFSFNGSRNYLIADVHGQLEDEIFEQLLPFFQVWIIQMKTEDEFDENVDKLIELCEKMKLNFQPKIILIIRDSEKKELNQQKIEELKKKELDFCTSQILNLNQLVNQAIEIEERTKIKKCILQQIGTRNEKISEEQIQKSFLQLCKGFNVEDKEIRESQKILNELAKELKILEQNEYGFYSIKAFPFRNLVWEIKTKKQQRQELNYTILSLEQELEKKKNVINDLKNEKSSDQKEKIKQKENEKKDIENNIKSIQDKLREITNKIQDIEDKKQKQNFEESKLIKSFSLIFKQDNYYITYLRFVEHIQKFNQKNLKNLNIEIEDLRKKIGSFTEEQKKERSESEEKLITLEKKYSVQNISIELFWREVIKGNSSFQQSPIKVVCQLIKKGEPFEFLNGDDLTIDSNFLIQLREELLDKDDNKILFLSILGPQSSGKSTLLNRIFGCHFLTSMGRCTKGVFLQLLKISNKEQFQNFDYILLLDSEGLQSPNQKDPEFDKKISLFIIQISDILIFNVKGEIHSTFHNLIEVCFYTLAKYSKLQFLKQFSWCFNQNSQINDDEKHKLLKQIEDIGKKLNSEENLIEEDGNKICYLQQLDLNIDHIYILGMATNSKEWQNSDNSKQIQEIKQEINLQDYSKNALSFGISIINKFINKYNGQQKNRHEILTWKTFITKVQQCWEIVSKLPDLVEFSDLKEQKDYETINKIATEKMTKANEKFLSFDNIIQQIQAKSELENSLENYNQIQKDFQQDFQQQCSYQKEEILNELQHEYSFSIISNAIRKKVEGNIAEVYQAIGLEGSLIILQKIHQLRRQFQYSLVPAKIQQTVNEIQNDSEQLITLQEDKSIRDNKYEQIWNELVESSNLEVEKLHIEFQKKLFDCFLKYKKQYQFKAESLEDQIDYFVKQINNQDPNTQKENQMEKICSLFLEDFQKNSFNTLNKFSKQQFQQIFDEDILNRLNNLDKSTLINPLNYLLKKTTYETIEKKEIVKILQKGLKQKLIQIVKEQKGDEKKQLEVQDLFNTLNQLPIQFDKKILQAVLDLIKKDFSRFKEILNEDYNKKVFCHATTNDFYKSRFDSSIFPQKIQSTAVTKSPNKFQASNYSNEILTQDNSAAVVNKKQNKLSPPLFPQNKQNLSSIQNSLYPNVQGNTQQIPIQTQPPNLQNKQYQQIRQAPQYSEYSYLRQKKSAYSPNLCQRYLQSAQTQHITINKLTTIYKLTNLYKIRFHKAIKYYHNLIKLINPLLKPKIILILIIQSIHQKKNLKLYPNQQIFFI
ncbi:unnamed protein product [Paramecium octaurelia]|uniref:VLIG-type G domain-containing protein n=1 Tax=Paramecium octaurelia TaxID=43137 RepID=A0A8S1WJ30_PAROT|nr:unnamed protein product [Paramecium octaurelia]